MKYSVCEETGLRVCEVYEHLLVREDGMVKNISGHHNTKKEWHSGSKQNQGKDYRQIWSPTDKKMVRIHRLIAIAFIDNPNNYPQINHINHIQSDNRVDNLEWCTNRQNCSLKQIHNNGKLIGAVLDNRDNKWSSRIRIDGKQKSLGRYDTELEAHEAYIQYKADHNII